MALPPTTAPVLDVTGRPVGLRDVDLDAFFHPRTVAVIGASPATRTPNTAIWRKISAWGARAGASVIPVNPRYDEIDGVRCYDSIARVPGEIDLAVILVGDAVAVFEQVLDRQPRFAVIFSAGFAETGPEGAALQRRLEDLVDAGSTHLLGPNTNLNAFESFREDLPAPKIALITQSGHQGRPVFQAQDFGVALSHWAPTGNEADLEFADFARYFADQDEVGVIACYIEGFKDGRTLMLAADHAARAGVPIVCVKVGRTDEGASMAHSHTGHLTGSDAVTSAVFRQFGVIRVDGLDELTDTAAMFARTKRPTGRGVCVYAISGGTGAHMADLLADAGLSLPPLTARTQHRLHDGLIAPYLRVSNPVDNGGPPSTDERGPRIIEAILADPGVDLVVCPITGAVETISRPLATTLVEAARTTHKPIFVVWGSPDVSDPVYTDILVPSGLPTFRTFHNCVQAARAYFDHWDFRDRYASPFDQAVMRPSAAARKAAPLLRAADAGTALSEHRSKAVLRAYRIPVSNDVLVGSAAEAARAAAAIGYPVVMKACSPQLVHKSDLGLVRVGVSSATKARAAYAELVASAHRADAHVDLEGVLVCETVTGGVETVIGVSDDELFGPVVMLGLGGVFVEVLGDVTFRVPPFGRDEAERMVSELRGEALLRGARGTRPADVKALVDTIMKVQRLAVDNAGGLAELDINPLVVRPEGQGVVALDALVVPR
jgi:acyl-CoA synthetase (NDP forming)